MPPTLVVLGGAFIGPHALLLNKLEDASSFQNPLGYSNEAIESRVGGILDEGRGSFVPCNV